MVEYAKYELKNVCSRLSSGKSISSKMISEEGRYPVYGGNGLRGYTDHSNFSGDCAIIGRQGAFCGNVRYFSGEAYMTEHAVVVCANNLNNTHYLAYLLSTMNLGRLSGQSAQPGLSVKTLGIQEIMLPSIEYQNKVVALLSSLDEKIAVNNNINDNLQQQAELLYHERFETVDRDKLPVGWRIVRLGDVATISKKSFNPAKEPEMLLEHYSIPAFDEAHFPVFEPSTAIKSNKFIVDDSCFMISKLNPTTKRVWKPYCLTENAVCSTEFIVYKAKSQEITDFLYSVIDSDSFSDFMCSHVTGSTGSRQRTTPSDTLAFELVLPNAEEIAEYQGIVSPMLEQIKCNAIENDRLKRLRDSLLPKLMSGEIDVSGIQL
ncbi:restriction endonuclease subunit S [Gemmiger formicilis]|uniref:restriction endonuclease subunit S n=1 Tax=Gemmiger formicilis TaxID=745368 RepID=UPI00195B6981|nr:restriction endonuclease subunit S [Gemmiger formicilis]MBM6899467.1 restriction endonuclease subunit S [Gemmiger formicilis]